MGRVNVAVTIFVGLIAAGFLAGAVPRWLYGMSLIAATGLIAVDLYRKRHVVFSEMTAEDII